MRLERRIKFLPKYRYQPETLLAYFPSEIGTQVAERSVQHVDKFIRDCKEAGIWSRLSYCMPFIGNNLTLALREIVSNAVNFSNNFVGGDFSEATGLTGDGSTKYLNLGITASTLAANDCHLSCYQRADNAQAGNRLLIGVGDASHHYWLGALTPASATDCRLGQTQTANGGGQMIKGFYLANRVANNDLKLYRNGAVLGSNSNVTAGVPPALSLYGCAWNNNGTPAGYLNTPISFLSVGQSFTAQQLTDYAAIVQTLQTNLGRAV